MTAPYTPTPFPAPALNPAIGGAGIPVTYVSNSQFTFAPTAMDTANLVPGGGLAQQAQALADVLSRASAWADRYCFGSDPAAKGASLAATVTVQAGMVAYRSNYLRLVCDYKPLISVTGVDVGPDASSARTIGAAAAQIWFGRRTIYVPSTVIAPRTVPTAGLPVYAAWSYVSGYPHTTLAAPASVGDATITVTPSDGSAGVLGVFPGTQLRIIDGAESETVTVTNVAGTTLTVSPLTNAHQLPAKPDFLPVTALPANVTQAVILLATALIKTRGDNSMVLASLTEPSEVKDSTGDEFTDVTVAKELLAPYRIRIKSVSY